MKFLIVLSLILLSHWCQELEASTQVVVNCGCDETCEKGDQGPPENRGAEDPPGIRGEKGSRGMKGEQGVCPSSCVDVERKILELQQNQEVLVECVENCNYGRCVKVNYTFVCQCETGYSGRFCNEYLCDDQLCGNNSRCTGPNQCTCDDGYQLVNDQCYDLFSNCNDVSQAGLTTSGIYQISISEIHRPVQVYCELNTNGGDWLVIQRRVNGNVDFDRDWADYQAGFGELDGDFWLGLDLIHAITSTGSYQLRIDIEEWNGNTSYAVYRKFLVGNSQSNYTLRLNRYSGTAGEAMSFSHNNPFTTRDRDNDDVEGTNCAVDKRSGWWHGSYANNICTTTNLNGQYYNNAYHRTGIHWSIPSTPHSYYYNLMYRKWIIKEVDMKIKLN